MRNIIKLAKKWHNSPTEYNRVQFIEEFNTLSEEEQAAAVEKGSELSKILIGWSAATRAEMLEQEG